MINQYWGATRSVPGGTFLLSKARLSIEEGFVIGNTLEYVSIGEFEVDSFKNHGPLNEQLSLTAFEPLNKLGKINSYYDRSYVNAKTYNDDFTSSNTFSNNFATYLGNVGLTSSTYLYSQFDSTTAFQVAYNGADALRNFTAISKFKSPNIASSTINVRGGIAFNVSSDFSTGYIWRIMGAPTNQARLNLIGGSGDTLYTTGFTPANNTDYWLMVNSHNGRIRTYISTNGIGYTEFANVLNDAHSKGQIGFQFNGASGGEVLVDNFEFFEHGPQFSYKDIAKSVIAMGGLFGTTFESKFSGQSGFMFSSGSSWAAGTSNNRILLFDSSSGNSWHTLFTSGTTFEDFILECKLRGSSGTYAGLVVGRTNTFYGNYYRFTRNDRTNDVEAFITSRITYGERGEHVTLADETWYDFKLIRNGLNLQWFINGTMTNSFLGTSFVSGGTNVSLGVLAYRSAGVSYVEMKDFEISKLDIQSGDITLTSGENPSSLLTRVVPEGYAINYENGVYKVFQIGSSRGIHSFGSTDYIVNSQESVENNGKVDISLVIGDKRIPKAGISKNRRITQQADNFVINIIKDENLTGKNDVSNFSEVANIVNNRDVQTVDLAIPLRPTIELYDRLNLIESRIGVSQRLLVFGHRKKYNSIEGSFEHSLELSTGSTDL